MYAKRQWLRSTFDKDSRVGANSSSRHMLNISKLMLTLGFGARPTRFQWLWQPEITCTPRNEKQPAECRLEEPVRPKAAYTLADLQKVLNRPDLLPPGITVKYAGQKDFSYLSPGMAKPIRVTTDPAFYDENSDSVEFWSPGSPLFPDGVEGQAEKPFDYESFQKVLRQ
jgi:hypothetical protein